ncbi:EsaB/YukD family protein [Thermodesulfobacteriota bacterium]
MSNLHIRVTDVSGSFSNDVETPNDVSVERIIALLVERMNLPLNSPDGQIMIYKLHHRRTGRQLLDDQTFAEAGVMDGDEIRLQPEITAGIASPD